MTTPLEDMFKDVLDHQVLPKQTSLVDFYSKFPQFRPLIEKQINDYFQTPSQKVPFLKIRGDHHKIELISLLPKEQLPSQTTRVMIERGLLWSAHLELIDEPQLQSVILPLKVGYNQIVFCFDILIASYLPKDIISYSSLEDSFSNLYPHYYFSQEIMKNNAKYMSNYKLSTSSQQGYENYFNDEFKKTA